MDHEGLVEGFATVFAELGLAEARWETPEFSIAFRRASVTLDDGDVPETESHAPAIVAATANEGTPVSSPMTGVFYASSSPSAPPFVREGDAVIAGQVVGLIEAMKVFNEIVATVTGNVRRIVAKSGEVVEPGAPLLYIG